MRLFAHGRDLRYLPTFYETLGNVEITYLHVAGETRLFWIKR